MIITLIGIIAGMITIFLLIYILIGFAITISLRRGIRKMWTEDEDLGDHWIFWAYLTCITLWYWVDWDNVEYQNNWAISIEMDEEFHEETKDQI